MWGLDEVDRLLSCPFASQVFGLLRSWHNERALDPTAPWQRLTIALLCHISESVRRFKSLEFRVESRKSLISLELGSESGRVVIVLAYATEAYLLITNLDQSPFNVGSKLEMQDFTVDQVADLNRRYGNPLVGEGEVEHFHHLLGGQPHLTRRGLREMVERSWDLSAFKAEAAHENGPFGDHLRRILVTVGRSSTLVEGLRGVLCGKPNLSQEDFHRLRSGGILTGDTAREARMRCAIYGSYLERHLL